MSQNPSSWLGVTKYNSVGESDAQGIVVKQLPKYSNLSNILCQDVSF